MSSNKKYRILGADIGKHRDPFAVVLIEIDSEKNTITILGAKQWLNQEYGEVEAQIADICRKQAVDVIAIEVNMNESVAEHLKREYQLPVKYITTSKNIKNPKPNTMDKNAMVHWMVRIHQDKILQWPELTNGYMKELYRQWTIFGEYHRDKFEAPTGEHDDLVMALMLACFVGKQFIKSGELVIVNASKLGESRDDQLNKLNEERDAGKTGLGFELKE